MAEAHQAVSYSKLVKHSDQQAPEKRKRKFENDLIQSYQQVRSKSWTKRFKQLHMKLRNFVYPAHLESFWVISVLVMGLHFAAQKVPYDLVNVVIRRIPG